MANQNKYQDALKQYNTALDEHKVKAEVEKIIAENFDKNNNKETYKLLYCCIDLTSLNATDTREDIWKFTEKVNDFEGSVADIQNVAAICTFPNFVETVKEALTAQDVKIACVSGGFPSSQTFPEVKIAETALAIANGAEEIDVVLNLGYFFEENYEELTEEIDELKHTCRDAQLKVILETGALKTCENIAKASVLALYSGADFLKTSTGKIYAGATLEATYVMSCIIKQYAEKNERKVGIKVSGGISTTEDAVKFYTIIKSVLGNEWCNREFFRIGSSKLNHDIIKNL